MHMHMRMHVHAAAHAFGMTCRAMRGLEPRGIMCGVWIGE